MSSAPSSIEMLLALARQRRLWPEVDAPQAALPERSLSAEQPHGTSAEAELALATCALLQQTAQTLGPRLASAQALLEPLTMLIQAGRCVDFDAAWAALDDLEDQLEALCR